VLSTQLEKGAREPVTPRSPPASGTQTRPGISLCSSNAAERPELERFIREAFERKHGAVVRSFMPVLLGMRNENGTVIGAAGYRSAAYEQLFLEQYLGEPIEALIARRNSGVQVARAEIAEIGNFACRDCASAIRMVGILATFLLDQRHRWVVFTATSTVRGIMRKIGIRLAEIAHAEPSRVAITADDWGRYYLSDPKVMLGHVPSYRGTRDLTWSI
jgi:hypothetical protein